MNVDLTPSPTKIMSNSSHSTGTSLDTLNLYISLLKVPQAKGNWTLASSA